jgi:hypothetical protein
VQSTFNVPLNATFFDDIDLRRDLRRFATGKLTETFAPSFLHETSHYECFASPVGVAIALLYHRVHRNAVRARHAHRKAVIGRRNYADYDLLDDLLKYRGALTLFRSLAEGLALFAEFDSSPGSSEVLTRPYAWTYRLLGARQGESNPDLFYRELLPRMRLDPRLGARRENVFGSPFSTTHGGHLAGYLLIKILWRQFTLARLHAHEENVLEPELFGAFVNAFVFHDYGLVPLILDSSLHEAEAANKIAIHFAERMEELERAFDSQKVALFEHSYLQFKSEGGAPLFEGITTPEERRLGIAAVNDAYASLSRPGSGWTEEHVDGFRKQLARRGRIHLSTLAADVGVGANGHITVLDGDHLVFGAPQGGLSTTPGRAAGFLEFSFFPEPFEFAAMIFRGGDLVRLASFSENDDAEREEYLASCSSPLPQDLDGIAAVDRLVAEILDESSAGIAYEEYVNGLEARIDDAYANAVAETSSCKAALFQGGLVGVAEQDFEFLAAMAFVGVAASVSPLREHVSQMCLAHGVDFDQTLERAGSLRSRNGFNMLTATDDLVFWSI